MKNYEGRKTDLSNKINTHLKKLTGQDKDFFIDLTQSDFFDLKTVLSDINNLLTFQMTIAATKWICDYFKFDEIIKIKELQKIDDVKPNSKGFDIKITSTHFNIIAEVKCTSPVNNGYVFGVAQHDSIMEDVDKLINGKGSLENKTNEFFKFLFLVDLGKRTDDAITQLKKETNGKSILANKYNGLKKNKLILLEDNIIFEELDLEKVYIKKIQMD